ncbi:MAG: YIP1 family protein [Limisphaerales bacterium]
MDAPTPPSLSEASPVAATPLGARLMNVFVAPGEVFEEVKAGPPATGNWLAPMLLACVVSVAFVWVVFSQDTILRSVREAQEKQIQKMVDAGKLQKDQAQAALNAIERFSSPRILKIGGSIAAVAGNVGFLFLLAVVLWLVGNKGFKAPFTYLQAVEVCGLASMINVLGAIVSSLVIVIMGNLQMSLGPVLLVRNFDPANKLHALLSSLNLPMLWYVGVLAVGLSKLSGVSFGKAALWAYGLWAALILALVLPGWGR